MPMQAPKAVTFEGRGGSETLQVAAFASKEAVVAAAGTTTADVALPLSSNGLAYAVYGVTVIGTDPVYFAFGVEDVENDHTTDNCDGVILGNQFVPLVTPAGATHIALITESGTPTVVIAPYV